MILDNKQKDFLNILLKEEDPVSIEMLQKQLNTSRRTIYYLVNKINEILMDNHFEPLQNKRGHGYFIEINEKQKIHEMINDEDEMEFLKPKERVYYLICWLLYPQSVVHVETMMNQFDISRNSVFNDLKNVKDELENYDLEINFDNKKGYFIDGKTF